MPNHNSKTISTPELGSTSTSTPGSGFVRRKQAAAYLDLAVGTLANMAHQGRGPMVYRRNGVPFYALADLDAYIRTGAGLASVAA